MKELPCLGFLSLLCSAAAMLVGCAAPTALTSKTTQLDVSQKSVVLVTVEMTREKDRKMPWLTRMFVQPRGAEGVEAFSVDSEGMTYGEDSRNYLSLLRISLSPGTYVLHSLFGEVSSFPLKAAFAAPLGLAFDVPPQSVVYVGRITAHMRTRQSNEFRAGPIFPLLNQSVLGIADSTFDISTSDEAHLDLAAFKESFPVLRSINVKTQRLSAFNRQQFDRAFMGEAKSSEPTLPGDTERSLAP